MTARRSRRLGAGLLVAVVAAAGLAAAKAPAVYVTAAAATLVDRGLAAAAPADATAAGFTAVPAPGLRFVNNQATMAPWVDSNAARMKRGVRKVAYTTLGPGTAPLAAAEAFTFGAEAVLNPDARDVDELGRMLAFLAANAPPRPLPEMVNIGVVETASPLLPEVLNLLSRRNLLYKVVEKPDPGLDLTVELGSANFPEASAANPSDFAARVRAKLGDDNRLVRLYGTSTVLAHLTGDKTGARLHLLAYSVGARRQPGGGQQTIRVRLLGRYQPVKVAAYEGPAGAGLTDVETLPASTEFTMPPFRTIAIVDLDPL